MSYDKNNIRETQIFLKKKKSLIREELEVFQTVLLLLLSRFYR